jgi:hypothetical protein
MGGKTFGSVEHYFEYMKFVDTDPNYAEKVRKAPTPYECKKLSNSRDHPIDPDWNSKRLRIMKLALFCKAIQHPVFAKTLLDTGRAQLIEAAPHDSFWGEGRDRTGRNMLGNMLMQLRKSLFFNHKKMYIDPIRVAEEDEEVQIEIEFETDERRPNSRSELGATGGGAEEKDDEGEAEDDDDQEEGDEEQGEGEEDEDEGDEEQDEGDEEQEDGDVEVEEDE